MIEGIKLGFAKKSNNDSPLKYLSNVDFFKNNDQITFKSGVNILFGPNGSGKSSILDMIAMSLAAKQGGVSKITQPWIMETCSLSNAPFKVLHDGKPVVYCNSRTDPGLMHGSFDDDFFLSGVTAAMRKASSGQETVHRLMKAINIINGKEKFPKKIENIDYLKHTNQKYAKKCNAFLEPSIEKGPNTIIIDEPESGLSYPVQKRILEMLIDASKKHDIQIIMSSHSPFVMLENRDNVNIIEMERDFLHLSRSALFDIEKIKKVMPC